MNKQWRLMLWSIVLIVAGCASPDSREGSRPSDTEIRKERSESFLRDRGVPVNDWLPLVGESKIRSGADISRRSIVLFGIVAAGQEVPRSRIVTWLQDEDLWDAVSPNEARFLTIEEPTQQQIINATWRAEALWVLLWSIGRVSELKYPSDLCDLEALQAALPAISESTKAFVREANLRETDEILDAVDLIYRTHWAVRDAQFKGSEPPAQLHSSIVRERHYALNWLVYYADEWDEITTDT